MPRASRQHVRPLGEAAADAGTVWYRQHTTALNGSGADDPFALISDTEYSPLVGRLRDEAQAGCTVLDVLANVALMSARVVCGAGG